MVTRYWYDEQATDEALRARMAERYIQERQFVGFMSPSGRISVGALPNPKELKSDKEYEQDKQDIEVLTKCHWDAWEGIVRERVILPCDSPPLGLSAESNHHSTQKVKYGLRGITDNGKSKVYEGVKLLEGRYGRRLGFYTLTCPYIDCSLIYEFNRNIGEIQRRWFQELRRLCERQREQFSYVSVVEVQPGRYEKDGVWCLHIHYVAPCYRRNSREWLLSATELRYLWMRVNASVLGCEADTSASVDSQVIKKSASGYLAKYVSKGSGDLEFVADIAPSQLPRQWWSMSANVRKALQRCTTQIPEPIAAWYFGGGGGENDGCLRLNYRRDVYASWKGQELRVGMTGQICQEGLRLLRNNSVYALSLLFL